MIWFTADTHFGHAKILDYVDRPFETVDEMDEALIKNWNERVQPNDDVYHLGDFGLCASSKLRKIIDRLNGKIHLIRGNHESSALGCKNRFVWIKDYHELRVRDLEGYNNKRTLVLFHYPMKVWNAQHYGTFHLFGHVHGTLEDDATVLSLDVGVDCHGYAPISYNEVKNLMKEKDWMPSFEIERKPKQTLEMIEAADKAKAEAVENQNIENNEFPTVQHEDEERQNGAEKE